MPVSFFNQPGRELSSDRFHGNGQRAECSPVWACPGRLLTLALCGKACVLGYDSQALGLVGGLEQVQLITFITLTEQMGKPSPGGQVLTLSQKASLWKGWDQDLRELSERDCLLN